MQIAVIGGGAAGFFAAIAAATHAPHAQVHLFEKTGKWLAKVKVSGGGRCNVTHACFDLPKFAAHYPRGSKLLKKALREFGPSDTVAWFEERDVPLKTEADGRMFPQSDSSQSIIDCLWKASQQAGVRLHAKQAVMGIEALPNGCWRLRLANNQSMDAHAVIVATGGAPKRSGLQWLADLGHRIVDPVPSLFTFNYPKQAVTQLMGVVAPHAKVRLQGSKLMQEGPLLITHWGMSGPAILKLSAFAARELAASQYRFGVQVNWTPEQTEDAIRLHLQAMRNEGQRKQMGNANWTALPQRLWAFLLDKAEIPASKAVGDLANKAINRLAQVLTNDTYAAQGKTTFKEEFVTCGGIDLRDIAAHTLESKVCPHLYFAGEVLDVDGITGGFNFQAAWTTGYIAGRAAANSLRPASY